MGAVAFNVTGLTDRSPVIDGRLVEFGHIFSLSARVAAGTTQAGRTHVQAGIFDGVPNQQRIIAVLLDDYVYEGHMPSWTGKLPMDEGTGFFGIVRSADGVIVQFAAYVQKHDP